MATLEAHNFGKIGGYGGEMSHYIEVTDSDYDTLRDIEKLSEINRSAFEGAPTVLELDNITKTFR